MKILILQNKLLHYRIPVFNLLNQQAGIQVTVAHPGHPANDNQIGFHQKILQVSKKGPFVLHSGLFKLCCNYDIVIAMFDLKWLTHMKLAFRQNRPFKLIFWGIGVSTEKGFDVTHRYDWARFYLANLSDALLLYSTTAKNKYIKANFPENKVFVASNTVGNAVFDEQPKFDKNGFVFLGSLDKRKRLEELIEAVRIISLSKPCKLSIVGDGPHKKHLENLIREYGLIESIKFEGQVNDLRKLSLIFDKSLACISPGQAGLSVQRSFSLGIPFVCCEDAITGGEKFDIKNDYNGFMYSGGPRILAQIMLGLVDNPNKAIQMGQNAFGFYQSHRTLHHMIAGFLEAINACAED